MRLLLLLLFVPTLAFSQLRTITGSIIDEETNEHLIGANVVLEYRGGAGDSLMKHTTYSDCWGQFSLSPKWNSLPDEFVLKFLYPGYYDNVKSYRGCMTLDTLVLDLIGMELNPNYPVVDVLFAVRPMFDAQSNFIQYLHREDLLNHPQR